MQRKTATRTATEHKTATKKRPAPKPVRGVFEHPLGSDVWWINYYVAGQRHREKAGARGKAVSLYQKRKSDALAGIKLPDSLRVKKAVLFSDLATDAMVYSKAHKRSHRGDVSNLNSLLPVFGKRAADEITQQEIAAYLNSRTDLKPASLNRYRSTMSLIYSEGIRNGRIKTNPAKLVRLRKENNARIRFVTFDEEALIRGIIRKRCPTHEPDFIFAVETGLRLSEQHTLEWPSVHINRRQVELNMTKNGSSRVVSLTDEAIAALELCRAKKRKPKIPPRVFLTRYGEPIDNPKAWFNLVMADAVEANPALKDVTWHTLRHTFISRLVMAGVDLITVQQEAGHKTLAMTARYAHLSPDHRLDAITKLSAYRKQQTRAKPKNNP
jgi:site-specific recombinase XerD